MGRLKNWFPIVLCVAAAVLVLFPLSVYPTLVHRSPNWPLHLLVLDHLTMVLQDGGDSLSHVVAADYPNGRPVRIIGWPFQLLAVPLVPALGRVAALNVSLLISLILSGVLMVRLVRVMGMGRMAQSLAGLAWVMNPLLVSFLSNGQYENHVGWALPLSLLGILRGGMTGHLMLAGGLLGAAFSSPYQAIPAAIIVSMVLLRHARPQGGLLIGTLGTVFALCYAYYSGPQPTPGGECGPTSGTMPLVLAELFGFTGGLDAQMPLATGRLEQLTAAFSEPVVWRRQFDLHNLMVSPGSGFLGWLPLFGGAIGLWRARHVPWATPLMLAGLLCLVLAMGPTFALTRGFQVDLPMPADLFGFLPGLSQMGTTLRFASGLAFALVIGLALLAESLKGRPMLVALFMGFAVADWAVGTVSHVPMPALSIQQPEGLAGLPEEGAVIMVPVRERVSPEAHLWMSAVIDRPVVGYCDKGIIDYREEFGIINFAQGGQPPDRDTIRADFQALDAMGISTIAFMVVNPGKAQFEHTAKQLQFLLGTADAVGDGFVSYRTRRGPTGSSASE